MTNQIKHAMLTGIVGCLLTGLVGCANNGADTDLLRDTDAWHAERLDRLAAEDGWLSLVGLEWLDEGANRVGRDPGGEVVYGGFPADHVATLFVEGRSVRVERAKTLALGFTLDGLPDDGRMRVDTEGSPTVLTIGGIRFHVVERGGRLAVRIKDADAPTRTGFAGIDRYPVNADWRIVAAFEPVTESHTITLGTVIGVNAEAEIAGWASFERDGHAVRALLFPAGDGKTYLRFGDATNGDGTYPIGRYLSIPPPGPDGTVLLDFNRSYNPPCAFTPFATCTLPPEPNEFGFEVDAGERWP